MTKKLLCLDFDGVLHSYTSGWKGSNVIPDPPVDGAMQFISDAINHFRVAIFSSRSNTPGGIEAMKDWLRDKYTDHFITCDPNMIFDSLAEIEWPLEKPASFVTIDDRALTFDGTWPRIDDLLAFQPWNKRPFGATGTFPQPKLDDDDQGGLRLGIAFDPVNGVIRMEFGKPVAWIGFAPEDAVQLAKSLLKAAGASKVEITL